METTMHSRRFSVSSSFVKGEMGFILVLTVREMRRKVMLAGRGRLWSIQLPKKPKRSLETHFPEEPLNAF